MRDSEIKVQCASHGEAYGAFVCVHLVNGARLGFNWAYSEDAPDAQSPDAWCDDCEAAREAAGGWTGDAEARADIKLVCESCYSVIRARNWVQDDEDFERLIDESITGYNARQTSFDEGFRIGEHERWDWNQDAAQLVFSNDGVPAVICDVVFVGSLSTRSNSWMWSWANTSIVEGVKAKMREVRAYGEEHRFEKLAGAFWEGEESDGWQMTAIATRLLGGIGAYRTPDENGYTFMVVTAARWAT